MPKWDFNKVSLQLFWNHVLTANKKKFSNFEKIPEMLGFDGEYPADHPEGKFWHLH